MNRVPTDARCAVTIALVVGLTLSGARAVLAQNGGSGSWPDGSYRSGRTPDYWSEIAPFSMQGVNLPPPPPGEAPAVVRGLYLNAWVFGSKRFYDLLELADTTEVNAFVIDVKDGTGYVTFHSNVPTAVAIGANGVRAGERYAQTSRAAPRAWYPPDRTNRRGEGSTPREAKPEWAVQHAKGGLWLDRQEPAWVDAFRDSVWAYAADIAGEAVLMGFREIRFDYVRFPDEPRELMIDAVYPARRGREAQHAAIKRNVTMLRDRVAALGVPFTIDVFGLTTSATLRPSQPSPRFQARIMTGGGFSP